VSSKCCWLLLVCGVLLAALLGCAGGDDDGEEYWDAGSDSDSDTDADIEYPVHTNPHLDMHNVMTGPISPPPEQFDELESDDADAAEELAEAPAAEQAYSEAELPD